MLWYHNFQLQGTNLAPDSLTQDDSTGFSSLVHLQLRSPPGQQVPSSRQPVFQRPQHKAKGQRRCSFFFRPLFLLLYLWSFPPASRATRSHPNSSTLFLGVDDFSFVSLLLLRFPQWIYCVLPPEDLWEALNKPLNLTPPPSPPKGDSSVGWELLVAMDTGREPRDAIISTQSRFIHTSRAKLRLRLHPPAASFQTRRWRTAGSYFYPSKPRLSQDGCVTSAC